MTIYEFVSVFTSGESRLLCMVVMTATERANVRQACEGGEGRRDEKSSGEELRRDRLVAKIEYRGKRSPLVAQGWLRV